MKKIILIILILTLITTNCQKSYAELNMQNEESENQYSEPDNYYYGEEDVFCDKDEDGKYNYDYLDVDIVIAVKENNIEELKILLDEYGPSGDGIHPYYEESLNGASCEGNIEIVKLLLGNIGSARNSYIDIYIPLNHALKSNHTAMAKLLIEKLRNDETEVDLERILYSASESGNIEIVDLLIENTSVTSLEQVKYLVNAINKSGFSVLSAATFKGHEDIVELLVSNGADINQTYGENYTVLMAAASIGNIELVKFFLDNGADIHIEGYYGSGTALMWASSNGHTEIAKLLIDSGALVNAEASDESGIYTALIDASRKGHFETAQLLIDEGADVNFPTGFEPIIEAAQNGRTKIVKLLIDNGADVNAESEYSGTALQLATQNGYTEVVKLLIDSEANIYIEANDSENLLMTASKYGQTEMVELFLSKGFDINETNNEDQTPLIYAVLSGDTNTVKLLLDKKADINLLDINYKNALVYALDNDSLDIMELLLKAGGDPNIEYKEYDEQNNYYPDYGNSLLVWAAREEKKEVVELLLKYKADVNYINKLDYAALEYAIRNNDMDTFDILISSGANVNNTENELSTLAYAIQEGSEEAALKLIEANADIHVKDNNEDPVLWISVSRGHKKVAEALIKKGALVNETSKYGITPLIEASIWGLTDIAKLLIDANADINTKQTDNQMTAIMYASLRGHTEIVKLLIEANADVNIKDNLNRSALSLAKKEKHKDIVKILKEAGAK